MVPPVLPLDFGEGLSGVLGRLCIGPLIRVPTSQEVPRGYAGLESLQRLTLIHFHVNMMEAVTP